MVVLRVFGFTGDVFGYDRLRDGPFEPDPAFTATFTGFGTARMSCLQQPTAAGGHAYSFLEATYEFSPVPEPLSLLTTGAGLTVLWRKRRSLGAGH